MTELDPRLYTIAWIAPLEIEARAATYMLDNRHHGRFPLQRGDDYVFQAGDICGHNVIIATLPAGQEYGTGSASALTSQIKKFFTNLWFGLLVGVAAGLPKLIGPSHRDIRLGDVLVALPEGDSAGLIAYDLGKETGSDGFQLLRGGHALAMTETVVRSAIGSIKLQAPDDVHLLSRFYQEIKDREHVNGTFADPGQDADRLYETDDSGAIKLKRREYRPDDRRTRIWYGPIGSGEKLMKDASKRDALRDKYNIIGIEMEAAGAMNRIPVGVIRGVCDYGDEHKNKDWQPYAAAMAAAYAKAVLAQIGPQDDGRREAESMVKQLYSVPVRLSKNFTGRQLQIRRLWQMLFTENKERVAIAGLGGMGKTQLALELAHRVRHTMKQYSILWISAQSLPAFEKTAIELVQKLALPCGDGEDRKEVLQRYLASDASGYWLLIIDNADDINMLNALPDKSTTIFDTFPQSQAGRIIITTRSSHIAVNTAGSDVIELGAMTSDEATSFLGKSLVDKSQLKQAEMVAELIEKLTCLPLSLAQAAAYMNMNRMSVITCLRLCSGTDNDMINLLSAQLRDGTKIQGAVATTWIVTFNTICETDTVAARLLSFIQWIEPKAIPQQILPEAKSEGNLTQSIGLLCGYSLLSWREDGETLDMHSLVHMALRFWTQLSYDSFMTKADAFKHLTWKFPTDKWENRLLWRQYLPHVLPLMKKNELDQNIGLELGYWVGRCLYQDGRIREGVEVLRLVVATQEKTLAENHPDRLASQHTLARLYQANGQLKKAILLLEHVVAIREALAKDHPARLASQHELASAYQANGQVKKAIILLEHVVATQEKIQADAHPARLLSQHKLATAYQANGQVEKAIILLEHVVATRDKTLAEGHPSRLTSQHALARAYQVNGQVKKAIRLLEHVVATQKMTLADNHPSQLASQHTLASVYRADGQVKKAITLLEHVVATQKMILAEDHTSQLASQHALAVAYQANGEVKKAIILLEHIIAVRNKTLADDHPARLASQHELAVSYQANGQLKEAITLLEHVVATREKTLEENNPSRLTSQYAIARAYQANGQFQKAIVILEHVVATRHILAETHPARLASQYTLARAYQANGQFQKAITLLEHIVATQETTLANNHPDQLASQFALATAYQANSQNQEAIALLKHIVAIQEKLLAEDHPSRLASQHALARAYQVNG